MTFFYSIARQLAFVHNKGGLSVKFNSVFLFCYSLYFSCLLYTSCCTYPVGGGVHRPASRLLPVNSHGYLSFLCLWLLYRQEKDRNSGLVSACGTDSPHECHLSSVSCMDREMCIRDSRSRSDQFAVQFRNNQADCFCSTCAVRNDINCSCAGSS